MRKVLVFLGISSLCLMLFLTGCEISQTGDSVENEVAFTVVEPAEVPAELAEIIEKNKQDEIKMSYQDQGYTYIVRGYGQQKTGGYSIAVNAVYLSGDGIHVDTSLIGPPQDKKIQNEASYPYIVIKIESQDQDIVFS